MVNKYLVETISMFRMRYVVEAQCAEHAANEVTMKDSELSEFSQKHLDEVITSTREINTEEYLRIFDEDNVYLRNWDNLEKLSSINVVDYDAS